MIESLAQLPFAASIFLLAVGLYAIVAKKNLVKVIVGVMVIEYAVNLFLLLLGYRAGGIAPILRPGMETSAFAGRTVDPLPQALVLTSIVIGLGVLALMVAMAVRLHEKYGTFDITEIKALKG
ncbi:MAG: sodium:proton antiporter [Gemmatimonadota bacterium]